MTFQTEVDRSRQRWARLKDNKCPLCNEGLIFPDSKLIHCGKCKFKIRPERMKQIVTDLVNQELEVN